MQFTVNRVKCGDCGILTHDTGRMLIDCGSSNAGDGLDSSNFAYSRIAQDIDDKSLTDLLITHFDKDHFNGILRVPDSYRFNTVYLPYSIISGKQVYTGAVSRLLSVASNRSWGFQLSRDIVQLFLHITIIAKRIKAVKRGDSVVLSEGKIQILWPDVTFDVGDLQYDLTVDLESPYRPPTAKKGAEGEISTVRRDVKNADSQVFASSEQYSELYSSTLEKNENRLIEFHEQIGAMREAEGLLPVYEDFRNVFQDVVVGIHSESESVSGELMGRLESARATLEDGRYSLHARIEQSGNDELLHKIRAFSRAQYHNLIQSMNAISVVCKLDPQFALLGDVPPKILNHIQTDLDGNYELVKVQHHGTGAYYSDYTPRGKNGILSNGGYISRKVDPRHLLGKLEGTFCTNAHEGGAKYCGYFGAHGRCSDRCIQMDDAINILL